VENEVIRGMYPRYVELLCNLHRWFEKNLPPYVWQTFKPRTSDRVVSIEIALINTIVMKLFDYKWPNLLNIARNFQVGAQTVNLLPHVNNFVTQLRGMPWIQELLKLRQGALNKLEECRKEVEKALHTFRLPGSCPYI